MAFDTKYVRFEGGNEYVDCSNVLAFERTSPFSISFWFRTADVTGGYMLGKMSGSTAYRGYGVGWQSSGALMFILRNDSATTNLINVLTTSTGWNDGAWHHVVWTFAGTSLASGITCTIDGSSQSLTIVNDALTATIVDTSSLWLGGASTASSGWVLVGHLDEVAIYDKALSLAEAQWIYNSGVPRSLSSPGCPSNLVGWWRMGDGDTFPTLLDSAGTPITFPSYADFSGNGLMGTAVNMEAGDVVSGGPGGSYSTYYTDFDGVNERISMGNVLSYEIGTDRSFSFWFKSTTTALSMFIAKINRLGWYDDVGYGVALTATGQIKYYFGNGGVMGSYTTVATGFNDGNWHHVSVSVTGAFSATTIVVDGVTRGCSSDSTTGGTSINTYPFTLGSLSNGNSPLAGSMDEVAVYSRAISVAEAQWIYNSGVPRSLLGGGAPANLAAWWRMGEAGGSTFHNGTMTNMEATDLVLGGPGGVGGALLPESFYSDDRYADKPGVLLGSTGPVGPTTVVYYKMRAQDSGASPPGYVTWVVDTTPDFAGAGYSGAIPTPVSSMVPGSAIVASSWEETA